jgi:hypothetical protein
MGIPDKPRIELIRLQGEYRTDSVVLAFEQALLSKGRTHGQDQSDCRRKGVLAIEGLEREVNNGGYDQFFINSSKVSMPPSLSMRSTVLVVLTQHS